MKEVDSDSKFFSYIKTLDSALEKLPRINGKVYRAVDLPAPVLIEYSFGKTVLDYAYLSSSKDSQWFERIVARDPKKTPQQALLIHSKSGVRIDCLSSWPEEQEVLFKRATKFIIDSLHQEVIKNAPVQSP